MKQIFQIIIFISLIPGAFSITINEIMYNPAGSDNNKEFIEIFSFQQKNLSDYIISDGDSNDTLILKYYNNHSNYSLIVEDDYLISTNNASIYTIGSTIGNGLSPSDTLTFYSPEKNIIDSIEINSSIANGNGYSMMYHNSSWKESSTYNGTPGLENIFIEIDEQIEPEEEKTILLETYLDAIIYANIEYTKLFRIKINGKDNCSEKDNVTVSYNISSEGFLNKDTFAKELGCSSYASTGEFISESAGNYSLCGKIINSTVNTTPNNEIPICMNFTVIDASSTKCNITLNITTNNTLIYNSGDSIKFHNNLNNKSLPYKIEYWIEDFFENIYKNKINTTNTNQKSWKTSISEQDRVLFIKSYVYPSCNDSNESDNYAEKMFIVKAEGEDYDQEDDGSSLEIIEVDDKVKFGETANIEVEITKGNTNKYSISLWVEDSGKKISDTTKIHLYDKYSTYHGQLPVMIDTNCNDQLDDGNYKVFLKGLDQEDDEKIKIKGNAAGCSDLKSTDSTSISKSTPEPKKKFNFELITYQNKIVLGKKFSTEIKIENDDEMDMEVKVWSYVYRGPKSYSGEREQNKKSIILLPNSAEVIELTNKVEDADPGDYKLKILINRNNQNTNSEITKDIEIIDNEEITQEKSEKIELLSEKENEGNRELLSRTNEVNNGIAYESTSEKAKNLVPYLIMILSLILNIALILIKF